MSRRGAENYHALQVGYAAEKRVQTAATMRDVLGYPFLPGIYKYSQAPHRSDLDMHGVDAMASVAKPLAKMLHIKNGDLPIQVKCSDDGIVLGLEKARRINTIAANIFGDNYRRRNVVMICGSERYSLAQIASRIAMGGVLMSGERNPRSNEVIRMLDRLAHPEIAQLASDGLRDLDFWNSKVAPVSGTLVTFPTRILPKWATRKGNLNGRANTRH